MDRGKNKDSVLPALRMDGLSPSHDIPLTRNIASTRAWLCKSKTNSARQDAKADNAAPGRPSECSSTEVPNEPNPAAKRESSK